MGSFFKRASILGLLLLGLLQNSQAFSTTDVTSLQDIIRLEKLTPKKFQLSQPTQNLSGGIQHQSEAPDTLSVEDSQNLKMLWQALMNRNPVIQFGLKQLATPPELRYAHSSVMSRTISGLLSGASLLPYMMGANQLGAGATAIGTNLADRAYSQSKKVDPSKLPSDTELVELSSFVQALQKSLVEHYFNYKNSLTAYARLEQLTQPGTGLNSSKFSSPLAGVLGLQTAQASQEGLINAKDDAHFHYLALERLVGAQGMQALRFHTVLLSQQINLTPRPIQAAQLLPFQDRLK